LSSPPPQVLFFFLGRRAGLLPPPHRFTHRQRHTLAPPSFHDENQTPTPSAHTRSCTLHPSLTLQVNQTPPKKQELACVPFSATHTPHLLTLIPTHIIVVHPSWQHSLCHISIHPGGRFALFFLGGTARGSLPSHLPTNPPHHRAPRRPTPKNKALPYPSQNKRSSTRTARPPARPPAVAFCAEGRFNRDHSERPTPSPLQPPLAGRKRFRYFYTPQTLSTQTRPPRLCSHSCTAGAFPFCNPRPPLAL
jgi:hypothetical protein